MKNIKNQYINGHNLDSNSDNKKKVHSLSVHRKGENELQRCMELDSLSISIEDDATKHFVRWIVIKRVYEDIRRNRNETVSLTINIVLLPRSMSYVLRRRYSVCLLETFRISQHRRIKMRG